MSQTVSIGATATFSVTATGTAPFSYQWRKNGMGIWGAMFASYTTPATVSSDNGAIFSVVVTDSLKRSTISNNATLTVQIPSAPSITTQPQNLVVTTGQSATFSVTATGIPAPTYQWYYQSSGNIGGGIGSARTSGPITGATSSTLTLASTVIEDAGGYYVMVSNSYGGANSIVANLTVNAPPVIKAQPTNKTVVAGQTATFSVAATGYPALAYQWRKNGVAIPGATSASYTTPFTVIGDSGSTFNVFVSNSLGSTTSTNAVLTVTPPAPPTITSQPASATVTAGTPATFFVTASGTGPFSYQWRRYGINISGATSASYTTPATSSLDDGAIFYVVVTNGVGSVTSNSASLTVNPSTPDPSIRSHPTNQTVSVGITATFSVTASGTPPFSYQWVKNGTPISGAVSASYTTPAAVSSDNGAIFYVVVTNSSGYVRSHEATLTVNPLGTPSITSQPTNQIVSVGQPATFSVIATGNPTPNYQWYKNGAPITNASSSSYTTPPTVSSDYGSTFYVLLSNSVGSVSSDTAVQSQRLYIKSFTATPARVNYGGSVTLQWIIGGGATPDGVSVYQGSNTLNGTSFDATGLTSLTVTGLTKTTTFALDVRQQDMVFRKEVTVEVSLAEGLWWVKDVVYLGTKEVAEVDTKGLHITLTDHLGSPRFELDSKGLLENEQKFMPFGESLTDPTTMSKFAKGFTNHEQTDPNGLIYMQARFYAPIYGRFLSPDPARDQHFELTQSWNIYSYVQNNPVMSTDPTGMYGVGQFFKDLGNAAVNLAIHNPITQAYLQVSDTVMTGPANRFFGKNWGMQSEMGKAADRGAGKMEMAAHAIKGPTEVMTAAVTGNLAGKVVGAVEGAWASRGATSAAESELVTVRTYTNAAGREGITNSGALRADTWVTLPGEVPPRAGHLQIEKLLEIQPGRGSNFLDFQVPASNLRIPANGATTSGGAFQFQLNEPVPIDPSTFRLPPGRPGG